MKCAAGSFFSPETGVMLKVTKMESAAGLRLSFLSDKFYPPKTNAFPSKSSVHRARNNLAEQRGLTKYMYD